MKKLVILPATFCFWVLFLNPLFAQNFAGKPAEKILVFGPQRSLTPGEILEYNVEWLGIPSGKMTFSVAGIIDYKGRLCYHLKLRAIPNTFFAKFYDVEYEIESFLDTERLYPHYYKKKKRFRNNSSVETIEFDRVSNIAKTTISGAIQAVINSPLKQSIKKPLTSQISDKSLDALSAIYYLRLQEMIPGKNIPFFIYQDYGNWQMSVIPGDPFIKDIRKNGARVVIGLDPVSGLTGFIFGKDKAHIYLTADERRIPVEFTVGTTMGYLKARIKKIPD